MKLDYEEVDDDVDGVDKTAVADVLESVIIYAKDANDYSSKRTKKVTGCDIAVYSKTSSASDQMDELSKELLEGSTDQNSVRKRLAAILKSGDPITEAKTTMVVLARKEMEKVLLLVDAIDRLETDLLGRIAEGEYEGRPMVEVSMMIDRLEKSMSRSLTVITKVVDNNDYSEFLLAYRTAASSDKEVERISKVAQNKESREKIRSIVREVAESIKVSNDK
jgi:hypothetical protein